MPLAGVLLLFSANRSTFSNRGNVWLDAVAQLRGNMDLGLGLDRWYTLQKLGALPQHFPHSQYLLLLFSGGWLAFGLHSLLMASWVRLGSTHPGGAWRIALIFAYATTGLTEVIWNPLTIDGLTWITVGITVASPGGEKHIRQLIAPRQRSNGIESPAATRLEHEARKTSPDT